MWLAHKLPCILAGNRPVTSYWVPEPATGGGGWGLGDGYALLVAGACHHACAIILFDPFARVASPGSPQYFQLSSRN